MQAGIESTHRDRESTSRDRESASRDRESTSRDRESTRRDRVKADIACCTVNGPIFKKNR